MLSASPFKEEFLHFLWRTKKLMLHTLQTSDGNQLEILDYGTYNLDSGPDFFNAKIKIGDTIWAGNIEMHVFSSDWKKHKHQFDRAYENVVLHVVYEHDAEIQVHNAAIPTLELKGKIPKAYITRYLDLIQSKQNIPCQNIIADVSPEKINLWKYTVAIERLEQKSNTIAEILSKTNGDWEECLYILIAKYFGSKVNTEAFQRLATSLPLSIVMKNKDNRNTIEALYFGQSGMLMANYTDPYFEALKKEYKYQQQKYQLTPLDPVIWKFSKLRPMNFPTIRIAQFASLMYRVSFLFSQIKEADHPKEVADMLKSTVSQFWLDHYTFGEVSKPVSKNTGTNFINGLLINAVAPILFLYGRSYDDEKYIDKAVQILEYLPPEKNKITAAWDALDIKSTNAFDSQALIQLKTAYCDQFRCLSCKIGNELFNGNGW